MLGLDLIITANVLTGQCSAYLFPSTLYIGKADEKYSKYYMLDLFMIYFLYHLYTLF